MRKILFLFFMIISVVGYSQPTNYVWYKSRTRQYAFMADSGMHIPTYISTPTIRNGIWTGPGNIGIDTTNNKFYFYSGGAWREAGSTNYADSLRRVGLNVQMQKGGVWTTQYTDSVGGGGGGAGVTTNIVYVDTLGNDETGVVGDASKPFKTINAALDATSSIGNIVVKIGIGTFDSISPSKIRSYMWLKGSKQPVTNSLDTSTSYHNYTITYPTKLINGTIINGGFTANNKYQIKITDLGFDVGKEWVSGGHSIRDAISITDVGDGGSISPPFRLMDGIFIENVTCLGDTSNSLAHSLLLSNTIDPIVNNVLLVGHRTGFGSKGVGGLFTNITSYWHTNCIVLKNNSYAPSRQSVLSNFIARSISSTLKETQYGLMLQTEFLSGSPQDVNTGWLISNGTLSYLQVAVKDFADANYYNTNISNLNIHQCATGIHLVGFSRGNINNCNIDTCNGGIGIWIDNATGGNIISGNNIRNATYDGMRIRGGTEKSLVLNNISRLNGNFGINSLDGNLLLENNYFSNNSSGNYYGVINGIDKPYLATGSSTIAGVTPTGGLQNILLGNNLILDGNTLSAYTDTITLASFSAGAGLGTDTAAFQTTSIYGSFYNDGNDTLIITKEMAILQGSSPSITPTVYWNDSLNVTAGSVKLINSPSALTNTATGISVTSFDNYKIPPGVWVWVATPTVGTKPTYFSLSLIGYKKRI